MPREDKPKLNVEQQIEHMRSKGIKFCIISEDEAHSYLEKYTYYFKLHQYTENYQTHHAGINKEKYIHLEFAYLKDIAIIDMRLRYLVLQMTLDIEHHAKAKLLHAIENSSEDGYDIVNKYYEACNTYSQQRLCNALANNRDNPFCGDIFKDYDSDYPVWALIEIVPMGVFFEFYAFCANRLDNKDLKEDSTLLSWVKALRNAAAHSNCLLNNLKPRSFRHDTPYEVSRALGDSGITGETRHTKMSNVRIQHIVVLFHTYKKLVSSIGLRDERTKSLHDLVSDRMFQNIEYYEDNQTIRSSFDFLKKVVDKWYPRAYNVPT